jgi:hypothetical protein
MSKKQRRLYDEINKTSNKQKDLVQKLKEKKKKIE